MYETVKRYKPNNEILKSINFVLRIVHTRCMQYILIVKIILIPDECHHGSNIIVKWKYI